MVTVKHNSTAPLGGGAKISSDEWNADHTVDGLGDAAALDVGTTAGTVAAGNHGHDTATTSDPGFMAAADKTKLDGVATGATANQTDAHLLARENHTGTQAAGTITGLATVATSGAYSDLSGLPSLFDGAYSSLSGIPSTFTPEAHTHTLSAITDSGYMAALDRATAEQIRGFTGDAGLTAERLADAAALITPSGASNWAPDWAAFVSANWELTGNRTLSNPTNVIPGTTRVFRAAGNDATERTISFGSNYVGDLNGGPVNSTTPLLFMLYARTTTEIWVSAMEDSS